MVGLYAEPLPKGFGFSDTAFRVFILMASRRLKSDRFFTSDYNAEIYTQAGLDWIDETTMIDVLLRHYPELGAGAARGRQRLRAVDANGGVPVVSLSVCASSPPFSGSRSSSSSRPARTRR